MSMNNNSLEVIKLDSSSPTNKRNRETLDDSIDK
jgi:hypothetical protein